MKALHIIFSVVMVFSFVACNSDEEKAQSRAESLINQQNGIAQEINSMGTPSSSWSEQELDDYEALVDNLERIENELQSVNGTNGITIYGDNFGRIPLMRARLSSARAIKNANQTVKSISDVKPTSSESPQPGWVSSIPVRPKTPEASIPAVARNQDSSVSARDIRIKQLKYASDDYKKEYGYSVVSKEELYKLDTDELESSIETMKAHREELVEWNELIQDELDDHQQSQSVMSFPDLETKKAFLALASSMKFLNKMSMGKNIISIRALDMSIVNAQSVLADLEAAAAVQAMVP